jgi:peptide/nickel transport system substrate-binding protein
MKPHTQSRPYKPRTRTKSLAVGFALVLALSSCATAATEEARTENRTLIYDLGLEINSLDPNAAFDVSSSTIISQIYEQLLDYDTSSQELVGELASSWESDESGTQHTFTLHDGVKFASGNALTSADVVFSFNRLKNLKAGSAYLMDGITVAAPDATHVVLTTAQPMPELPAMVATTNFAVLDSVAVTAAGGVSDETAPDKDTASKSFDSRSYGSGAYQMTSYQPNAEVVLAYNDKYHGDKPDFTDVIIRNSRSIQQQITNIQNGGSDLTNSLPASQVTGLDKNKVNVLSRPLPQEIYLALTNSGGPTVNDDYRRAVALGIDYQAIVGLAGEGAVQGTGVIPTSVIGSFPAGEGLTRDVEAAKRALAASGMADQELVISYGSDYTIGGQDMGLFAQKIQFSLQEIGLKVRLDGAPTQVSRTANQQGNVQAALWPFPPDYADASQFLIHSPGGLLGKRIHWTEEQAPELAALAQKAHSLVDEEERDAAYLEWNKALRETNRFISVVEVPQSLVSSKRVEGLAQDVLGYPKLDELKLAK